MDKPAEQKKRWSLTFKTQIIASALVLLVLIGVPLLADRFLDPQSESTKALYYFCLGWHRPSIAIIRAIGMEQRFSPLAYDVSMLVVNTLIVFCTVGAIGKAIGFIRKNATRT